MDVDFVEVDHDLVAGQIHHQSLDFPQSAYPPRLLPRAFDDRLGPLQPDPQPAQESAHGGDADRDLDPLGEHQDQQFLGPGGSSVAKPLRRLLDQAEQFGLVGRGDLGLAVVLAAVGEPCQAPAEEPPGDAVHLGLRAEPALGDHGWGRALHECEDDLATTPQARVAGAIREPAKFLPLMLREFLPRVDDFGSDQGGAPSTGVLGNTT